VVDDVTDVVDEDEDVVDEDKDVVDEDKDEDVVVEVVVLVLRVGDTVGD